MQIDESAADIEQLARRRDVVADLRRLGDLALHVPDDAPWDAALALLRAAADLLGSDAEPSTTFARRARAMVESPPDWSESDLLHPVEEGCVLGLPSLDVHIVDNELRTVVELTAAHEGAPDAANGAFLLAVVESAMAVLVRRTCGWGAARKIEARFLRPTFLFEATEVVIRITDRSGPFVRLEGTVRDGAGRRTIAASGEFMVLGFDEVTDRRGEARRLSVVAAMVRAQRTDA